MGLELGPDIQLSKASRENPIFHTLASLGKQAISKLLDVEPLGPDDWSVKYRFNLKPVEESETLIEPKD